MSTRALLRDLAEALARGLERDDPAITSPARAHGQWMTAAWGGPLPEPRAGRGGAFARLPLVERLFVAESCALLHVLAGSGPRTAARFVARAPVALRPLLAVARSEPAEAFLASTDALRSCPRGSAESDPAQQALLALLPASDRRAIGLHPTPPWAARQVVQQLAPLPAAGRVLDPAAGTGVFLVEALAALWDRAGRPRGAAVWDLTCRVAGVETSPLLAAAAAANLERVASNLSGTPPPYGLWPQVGVGDVLCDLRPGGQGGLRLGPGVDAFRLEPAELVLGNPPWVAWDRLPAGYKEKLAAGPLEGLDAFSLHGFDARLGGANDDVSLLFVLLALAHLTRPGGRLAFLLKWNVISNEAARVLRRFEVRPRPAHSAKGLRLRDAVPFALERLVDLRQASPFRAQVEPALFVFRRNAEMGSVLLAERWVRTGRGQVRSEAMAPYAPLQREDPQGPWAPATATRVRSAGLEGTFAWTVRQGLKHDCNGVFLLCIEDRPAPGLLRVRNQPELARRIEVDPWEGLMEPTFVRPIVQSRHVRAFRVQGWRYGVVPVRAGRVVSEATLAVEAPRTLAYLREHREPLVERRSKVFSAPPFYRVFGYGPYSEAPALVVWSGMGFRPWFAVLEQVADPWLGLVRPLVDSACYLIPCETSDEAHYLAGLLNSAPVREFFASRSSGSKRGLGGTMLRRLELPRYVPADPVHRALAAEARRLSVVCAPRAGGGAARGQPSRGGAAGALDALEALAAQVLESG